MIALACDHGGFHIKEVIRKYLEKEKIPYRDFGTYSEESVDYPDFIYPAAMAVSEKICDKAILIDGIGSSSAAIANRLWGVMAAVCNDHFSAQMCRQHSNANAMCIGGKIIGDGVAIELVKIFLNTEFLGGKYAERLKKVEEISQRHLKRI